MVRRHKLKETQKQVFLVITCLFFLFGNAFLCFSSLLLLAVVVIERGMRLSDESW